MNNLLNGGSSTAIFCLLLKVFPGRGGGGVNAVVLYRKPPFQVELVIVAPNTEIPDHIHPNVDSFEIYISGTAYFRKHGKVLISEAMAKPDDKGVCKCFGQEIRVLPHDDHGGFIGEKGGCFLSIQKWENGVKPNFVGYDWRGEVVDPEQKERITNVD